VDGCKKIDEDTFKKIYSNKKKKMKWILLNIIKHWLRV